MGSIYNITTELKQIYDKLECGEGIDLETGEIKPEIANELALTQQNLQTKALDYGYVIKSFDDEIDIYDREIKRLQERKEYLKNTQSRLKQTLSNAMQDFGIVEIKGETLRLSFRESESVEVIDEDLLTIKFKQLKFVPDKIAIKKALKNGEDVQGARLVKNQNLQIK